MFKILVLAHSAENLQKRHYLPFLISLTAFLHYLVKWNFYLSGLSNN